MTIDPHVDPGAYLIAGLAAHARGEPVDDDTMQAAATLFAGAELVRAGLPIDRIEQLLRDRDHDVVVRYEAASDELVIELRFR